MLSAASQWVLPACLACSLYLFPLLLTPPPPLFFPARSPAAPQWAVVVGAVAALVFLNNRQDSSAVMLAREKAPVVLAQLWRGRTLCRGGSSAP